MKKSHKTTQNKTAKGKVASLGVWKREWEKKYEKDRKGGRFIKEDGIC